MQRHTRRESNMLRIVTVLGVVLVLGSSDAQAQIFFKNGLLNREFAGSLFGGRGHDHDRESVPNRYKTPYPTTSSGISIGIGSYPYYRYPRPGNFDPYRFDNYVHDPYETGRFRAPDLLNDPYFRERHRYDSAFRSRRHSRSHARQRKRSHQHHGHSGHSPSQATSLKMKPATLPQVPLADPGAPAQLAQSLSQREDAEAWMEFLAPDRIDSWIAEGNSQQIRELHSRYEAVLSEAEFDAIAEADGFLATERLLSRHVARGMASPQ